MLVTRSKHISTEYINPSGVEQDSVRSARILHLGSCREIIPLLFIHETILQIIVIVRHIASHQKEPALFSCHRSRVQRDFKLARDFSGLKPTSSHVIQMHQFRPPLE